MLRIKSEPAIIYKRVFQMIKEFVLNYLYLIPSNNPVRIVSFNLIPLKRGDPKCLNSQLQKYDLMTSSISNV